MNASEGLAAQYLASKGLDAQRFSKESMNGGKTSDFRVYSGGRLVFYCEVKEIEEKGVDGLVPDSTFNKITRHVSKAARQLEAVNSDHSVPNVMIIVCSDPMADVRDLRSALSGYFIAEDRSLHPIYSNISARLKKDLKTIDLYVWLRGNYPRRLGTSLLTGEPVDDPAGPWYTVGMNEQLGQTALELLMT